MITTWSIERFKSVYDKTNFQIAPLTIFAGANSSGKSTVIQSLLLTAQTLQSTFLSRPIILNGHIIRLGTFNDIVFDNNADDMISIGFKLTPTEAEMANIFPGLSRRTALHVSPRMMEKLESLECEFSFSSKGKESEREILQLQPCLEGCHLKAYISMDSKQGLDEVIIRKSEQDISNRLHSLHLTGANLQNNEIMSLEYEVTKPGKLRPARRFMPIAKTKIAGAVLEHFLPSNFTVAFDAVEAHAQSVIEALRDPGIRYYIDNDLNIIMNDSFISIINEIINISVNYYTQINDHRALKAINELQKDFSLQKLVQMLDSFSMSRRKTISEQVSMRYDELIKTLIGDRQPEYTVTFIPTPGFIDLSVNYIKHFFTRMVKYLGPLRDEPKALYPLIGANDPRDIGFRGENTAAVLDVYRNHLIEYIPSASFNTKGTKLERKKATLLTAVLDWLEYMGIANDIKTFDIGKLGHEMKVTPTGDNNLHDLTHVGVGVSQILPILVLSLITDPGSTLIFEQPELHLHPRVQTRLADFFLSLTTLNKQCIVETHSEYLINRLRYQVAIAEEDEVTDKIMIYFVEKQDKRSTYRQIEINRFGVIEQWPRGFFDENEEIAAAILRAGFEKSEREKNKK